MFLDTHPGFLFVIATLLPLTSFLFLLLAGAVRLYRKPGSTSGIWPAYVATGAIALAFVVCFSAFLKFQFDQRAKGALEQQLAEKEAVIHGAGHEHGHSHGKAHGAEEQEAEAPKKAEVKPDQGTITLSKREAAALKHQMEAIDAGWKGHITWARLNTTAVADTESGTILTLGYNVDHLTVTMFMMVTFIATLIHLFSIGYMSEELAAVVEDHHVHTADGHLSRRGRFGRFFLFLSLFCFSMLNLILADNLFQVFLSWELVGICSYLLIGFYYERQSASNAANKAFITNRVGDAGFIIGVLIFWTYVGTLNFEEMFARVRAPLEDAHGDQLARAGYVLRAEDAGKGKDGVLTARITPLGQGSLVVLFPREPEHLDADDFTAGKTVEIHDAPAKNQFGVMPYWLLVVGGLGIFLGCVGKSAQFPLHVWLPDAMEGPTPVSALIHAATMVAAGVYLVGRCFPLFTPESRLVIAYTGAVTLFVAATIALVMTDIKKVLAYSTVSQLGYMMLALGIGGWVAGLFHLVTHAFFKALLFLGSGSVIYNCHHEQEMPKMGGLYPKMKITALTMLMGVLAIAGTPFFSGWYSKDAVIAQAMGFVDVNRQHVLLLLLPLVTAGLTTFYMFRMWLLTFTGKPRDAHVYDHAHEAPALMTIPLIILGVMSVVVAWGWPIWDAKASLLESQLHHAQHHAVAAEFGEVPEDEHQKLLGSAPLPGLSPGVRAHELHALAGFLALVAAGLGAVFAYVIYYFNVLDPTDTVEQFPAMHRFLANKWYFDELYSVLLVRPALTVAYWCRAFDTNVIDGAVNRTAAGTVEVSRWNGLFDKRIIDGLVNLIARVTYGLGNQLRHVQTGSLRGYVLFLALAIIGIFAVLSYVVSLATAAVNP